MSISKDDVYIYHPESDSLFIGKEKELEDQELVFIAPVITRSEQEFKNIENLISDRHEHSKS